MNEAIYSTYYCIGLMKLNKNLDFFDSQIQCAHVLMDKEEKNVVEINNQKNEYSSFENTRELFDFLTTLFVNNHAVDKEIIRVLLSCAFEKEDDYLLPKGRILLGIDANSVEDLEETISKGKIGIIIQTISGEEFKINDNVLFVQGRQCSQISDVMENCSWNGMPTVAFYID